MSETSDSAKLQLSRTPIWQGVRLPLRLRIFEAARRLGESSVTELAQAVGLNRTALYFHLRHLEKAGVLTSRAGEPTPGRRGKRPRYYRVTAQELTFPVDTGAKRDVQRLAELLKPWMVESRVAALDAKAPGGFPAKRVALHWENLNDDEINRIRSLCNELDEIMRRARNRSNNARKAPTANMHVAMIIAPVDGHVMPGPEMKFKFS